MSLHDMIKVKACEFLDQTGIGRLLHDIPIEGPLAGDPKRCDYFNEGYEVPILFKYRDKIIKAGSVFSDSNAKVFAYPEPSLIKTILYDSVRGMIEQERNDAISIMSEAIQEYHQELMSAICPGSGPMGDPEDFLENLRSGRLEQGFIEKIVLAAVIHLPDISAESLISIELGYRGYLCLDIFPQMLAYYETEKLPHPLSSALDSLLVINSNLHQACSHHDDIKRRIAEDEVPIHHEPVMLVYQFPSGDHILELMHFELQSNIDLLRRIRSCEDSIRRELSSLRTYASTVGQKAYVSRRLQSP